ncbi:uncharacterized protein [Mytilus edulis]|uniref:uncharacterized protein n=1 Tax=Mytilus edulis TaxID=6550 RepID=UPI0039EF67E4
MANPMYSTLLSYFNSSSGVSPIVSKLSYSLQEKWTTQASNYKKKHSVPYPPFSFFINFIRDMCQIRNDPAFSYSNSSTSSNTKRSSNPVLTRKVEVSAQSNTRVHDSNNRCPIHKAGHTLSECRGFQKRPFQDRQRFLREKKICFRCCQSNDHISRNCNVNVKCSICGNNRHVSSMHIDRPPTSDKISTPKTDEDNGGELSTETVSAICTRLCGNMRVGRSCGKTVLVDVFSGTSPEQSVRIYAIIDDQSNHSLATPDLFDRLGLHGSQKQFVLSSCSGSSTMVGRYASGIRICSIDGQSTFDMPEVIECDSIPSDLHEIPTPDVANAHPHLHSIAPYLPALDPSCKVELLIGRDLPEVHHVTEQIIGGKGEPFAQKLPLGWVVIGEVCLGKVHAPSVINVRKTHVLNDGRHTTFPLCNLNIKVNDVQDHIFVRTQADNKLGPSVQDRQFLELMQRHFRKDENGLWSAPLPFIQPKPQMPNNRYQAWKRAQILDSSLRKDSKKLEHFVTFMSKVISSGAAEVAPDEIPGECWYLPLFGVYHPKKPNQIRGVFDSSALYEGVSLNSILMSGPDLTNNLVGVLMRFRKNRIAITGDVEQMFYQFHVDEYHRDYLRFFWYENNDITKPLIEYRMKVHVFGNTPSPAVATYGLREAVSEAENDVRSFVTNDFYVDDGLISFADKDDAIDLMQRTQKALKDNGNIRLHKIISNDIDVMKAFPLEDLGKELKDLDLCSDTLPVQHSLGLSWNLQTDMFIFRVNDDEKPITRRGILSTINSLFDPLGFITPLVISGKILLREVVPPGTDWDDPLSIDHETKWKNWLKSLKSFSCFEIPRMIVPVSISLTRQVDIHIFSDASEQAISAVAYLEAIDETGSSFIGFLTGKSKLAPIKGHTIPRLELCGAVLATEDGEAICHHMNLSPSVCHYYTDSRVVLGYICNTTRRFFTYVSNRVEKIHTVSEPSQWSYVSTDRNPADLGTRFISCPDMQIISSWINGPKWLLNKEPFDIVSFPLLSPHCDKEIRPEIVSRKTQIDSLQIDSQRYSKFSSWRSLVRSLSLLRHIAKTLSTTTTSRCKGWHICVEKDTPDFIKGTETLVIRQVQKEFFEHEIDSLNTDILIDVVYHNKVTNVLNLHRTWSSYAGRPICKLIFDI